MAKDGRIELIARGALMRRGSVLVCRDKKGGYAYLPGGHVEFGETAEQALIRELKEESGLQVRAGACALVHEHFFEQKGAKRHELTLVFHMEPAGTEGALEEVKSLETHLTFEWMDLASVGDQDLRPQAQKAWLMAGAPMSPEFLVTSLPDQF